MFNRRTPVFMLILLLSFVFAQLEPVQVEGETLSATDTLPTDPAIRSGVLDNGITYYLRFNDEPRTRADMALVVAAGSTSEDDDQQGVAHFLEHMLFNGTTNFEGQEIINFLERAGMTFGPDVNAYTSFDETVYTLQIPLDDEEVVNTSFDIFYDWATNATLDEDEIDKERGVIVEEERARDQDVGGRVTEAILPVLLGDTRYAERLPIGDLDIVRNAPREAFVRFYETYYRPDNMALVAVGDFDLDEFEARIQETFSTLENPSEPLPDTDYAVPLTDDPVYFTFTDPEFPVSTAQLTYKSEADAYVSVQDFADSLTEGLFSIMLNRRLSERAQSAEPPYLDASVGISDFIGGVKDFTLSVTTEEGALDAGISAVIEEGLRVQEFGFTETELERAKTDLLNSLQTNFDERDDIDSSAWRSAIVEAFLADDYVVTSNEADLELGEQLLPQITVEAVNEVAPDFSDSTNRVALVLAPEKEGLDVPDEAALESLVTTALDQEVTAYEDQTPEGELLDADLEPVQITEETYVEDLDTTLFTLENGVQVIFKPTDFTAQEVLLSGVSYGGTSLYDDEDYLEASFASDIISESGVGEYTSVQVQRLLTGQNVGLGVSIGDITEGMSGSADEEDLESLFQLVYLYATSPRQDEAAFERVRRQLSTSIRNRDSQPQAAFRDAINEALYGDGVRFTPLTQEAIDELDYARAFEIYQERFEDMGDFTFTIVGDTDLERVKELAQRYLGNLPSTPRVETFRNTTPPLAGTAQERDVYRGLEEQSILHLRFDGPFLDTTPEQRATLSVLESVLDLRMREAIREELGGTYSPQVFSDYEQRPLRRYTLGVQFTADPQRIEELEEAALDVFYTLRAEGPSEDDLLRAKQQFRRSREESLEANRYWTSTLPFYFVFNPDEDPSSILEYQEVLDSIEAEDVHELAQRFIVDDRYLEVALYPEAYQE